MTDRLESTLAQIERRLCELSDASEKALTGNARSLQYGMVVGGVDALNEMGLISGNEWSRLSRLAQDVYLGAEFSGLDQPMATELARGAI